MGTKLPLLQKSGKAGLGWQTPKPTSAGSTPTRNTETPRKMSLNLNHQKPQGAQKSIQETQTGKYPTQTKRQWEAEMERLNSRPTQAFSSLKKISTWRVLK